MKRGIRYMWITVLILAAVLAAVLAALLATPLGDRPLAAMFPVGAVAPVDFAGVSLSGQPNHTNRRRYVAGIDAARAITVGTLRARDWP